MSDFVRQSRKAQLKTEQPMNLFKVNAYLVMWGLLLSAMALAYGDDFGVTAYVLGGGLLALTLAANIAVYSRFLPVRMFGYAVNITFHAVVLISAVVVVYQIFANVGFHGRYGTRGPAAALVILGIVWYYNPFVRVIKTDLALLQVEREGAQNFQPDATADEDVETSADWDQGRGRPKYAKDSRPRHKP